MNPANQVVNILLETGTNRVCSACEQEFGAAPEQPGTQKSHGLCRRHSAIAWREAGFPDKVAELDKKPDDHFAPDMASAIPADWDQQHGTGAILK